MIKENPFYILEVSTRDTRQKIVEMAEDKSLELDEELVQKAQSNLVTPSRRLTAELDWFPGVAPARISKIIDALDSGNLGQINQYDLPILAQINFYIELLENENVHLSKQNLRDYIENIVKVFDSVDVDIILRDINEDRMIAKFPEIDNPEPILTAIADKKRIIVKAILSRLNQLDIEDLIQTLTKIVDDATSHGEYPSSDIIDDIVDDYKLHVQKFLEEEAEKIEQAIEIIQEKASKGEKVIEPLVDKLLNAIQKWDDVAQPIQLSTKSRGTNDVISEDVARKVRSLGIDLFNNYQYVKLSQKISEKIKILFEELPEVHEQIKDDVQILKKIEKEQENLIKNVLLELKIEGIQHLSSSEILAEIQQGAKFKRFSYCHSFLVVTYNKTSPIYFIKSSEGYIGYAMPYIIQSLLLGWWGFPWGPIYTIGALFQDLFGGENMTEDIKKILKEVNAI